MSVSVEATTKSYYYLINNGLSQSFSVSATATATGDVNDVDSVVDTASRLSIYTAFQNAHSILAFDEVTAPFSIYINTGVINFTSETTTIITIL